MRRALALLFLLILAGCDHPPDGIAVSGEEARAYGFAVARQLPDGSVTVEPDPLSPREQRWLLEHDYVFAFFDPDMSNVRDSTLAVLQMGRPPGDQVVAGYSVYWPASLTPRPLPAP
jgi:hypothetical protein